jgi:enolase
MIFLYTLEKCKSMKQTKITKIQAREILDSRGNPTVETTVWSGKLMATAAVPSGASTGSHEAHELRDGDKKRYGGMGVLKACRNVNDKIFPAVKGMSCFDQAGIDQEMIKLDGTPSKRKLGANAILSVSLAAARLAAHANGQELYQYLAKRYGYKIKSLPVPLFNVINGGVHADSGLDIQEYFLIPQRGKFSERLRQSVEVTHVLKKNLAEQRLSVGVGDEGGFAPHLKSNEIAFKQLVQAVKDARYKVGKDFQFGFDAAASEFFESDKELYRMKASQMNYKPAGMYKLYEKWIKEYPIQIIEDGCSEDDFLGWQLLTQHLSKKIVLVGDDVFVTNPPRINSGIINGIANAVLIKVNQIGTVTETIEAIKLAQRNKYKIVISHRSGETLDTFIADLAVAVNAEYIKAGAPTRGERIAKYNRLAEIERQL